MIKKLIRIIFYMEQISMFIDKSLARKTRDFNEHYIWKILI